MSEKEKKPKKRGRKPKKKLEIVTPKPEIISDEEPLIAHLSINLQDVVGNNTETNDSSILEEDSPDSASENDSIFIKNDDEYLSTKTENSESTSIENLENQIKKLKFELFKRTRNNKIIIDRTSYDKNTKCWWCKNCFDTPSVGIPELYFENKFYCHGNFCSFNCALAYNINSGDNVWKKTSLLNLLYYKTYSINTNIKSAPDWKILKEFGGHLSIEEFRRDSIVNTSEYTLLHPPLETRVNTFEKSFKVQSSSSTSVYQRLLEDSDELVLKRSKPLKSSQYSLDKTLFIKKKKEKKRKMNKGTASITISS